jgi:hypothetical protein
MSSNAQYSGTHYAKVGYGEAQPAKAQYATPEQLVYADLLDMGMKVGFALLVITFLLYVSGIIEPHVPLSDLPHYWSMPVGEYLRAADVHTGWSWLGLIGKGDFMNFAGIALLGAVTIGCYIRILPLLLKNRDTVYGLVAIAEVLVLALAASGILVGGGH